MHAPPPDYLQQTTTIRLKVGGYLVEVSHASNRFAMFENVVPGGWEQVEIIQCDLSSSATLVNILRTKLGGQPVGDALKNPDTFIEAIREFKTVQRARRARNPMEVMAN